MSEQQSQIATATATAEKPADAWGQPISAERQAELQGYLDRWAAETDHGERKGPFDRRHGPDRVWLTGADVFYLAARALVGTTASRDTTVLLESIRDLAAASEALSNAPEDYRLRHSLDLSALLLQDADLSYVHLERASLYRAHLEGAYLYACHLEGASLHQTHLEGAFLAEAHLESAYLFETHLEGAGLSKAHLEGAVLSDARLEGANFGEAHLEDSDLFGAHLEGTFFQGAYLERAVLRHAWMDKTTDLHRAALDCVSLDLLSFDGANLAVVKWETVTMLGDEVRARATKDEQGKRKNWRTRLDDYEAAVRAHLQLAAVMRSQGISEQADRFAYRAQVLRRPLLRLRRRYVAAFGSWLLDLISGYGYRPIRSFITYVLVILAFAAAYLFLGNANGRPLQWNEAIVISMTAFHGRGFFSAVFQPGDLQAAIAAVEAFVGLMIEIVFIATFTQRFFAR